jgi:cysteine synthase A
MATDAFDRYPVSGSPKRPGFRPRPRAAPISRSSTAPASTGSEEGTRETRRERWHNQKYFTWVEQQGKSVDELRALDDQGFWAAERAKADDMDRALLAVRPPLASMT